MAHGIRKITCDVSQSRQEEVAEAVPLQSAPGLESVLEQTGEEGAVLRQRHHTIADIAGRQDIELSPQPPRTAAIVGNGDDGGDIEPRISGLLWMRISLQAR